MHNNYSYKEAKNILKQDLEIPECVESSINEAFEKIDKNYDRKKVESKVIKMKKINNMKKCAAAVAAIMIFGTGTTVTAKTFLKWNDKVAERFEADEKMQNDLIEQGMVTELNVKDTVKGVTIETDQMVSDDKYIYVLFKVTAPEDMVLTKDTFCQELEVKCEDESAIMQTDAGVLYEGDEKFQEDGKTNVVYWQLGMQKDKDLTGKNITVSFKDLCTDVDNQGHIVTILEGNWNLSWTLSSSDKGIEKNVNTKINNSEEKVKKIKITPLSIYVEYDIPNKIDESIVQDGEEAPYMEYTGPASAYKVKMVDGTIKDLRKGMGRMERKEPNGEYIEQSILEKMIDIENVQSIIFGKGENETEINIK